MAERYYMWLDDNYKAGDYDRLVERRREEREQRERREREERARRERESALQRQRDYERQIRAQQLRAQQQMIENQRIQREQTQKRAEAERLEKERIQREMAKKALLNELESTYLKLRDSQIPNINRLSAEIMRKYNNEYILKYAELKRENDRLSECHIDILNDPSIRQFVLLGKTGDGKSTFGNRLSGDHSLYGDDGPFGIIHGTINSVTTKIKRHTINNQKISIVDTPGIFDTNNNDNFHLNEVVKHLKGANGINAFVLCCKADRLDSKYQEMLKDLQTMLTPTFWRNAIFVVTHCQDQYAQNWVSFKTELWQTINRKLELRNGAFKQYQIIGVNNNDRTSYSLCIQKLLKIVNDANKFNRRRFKSNKLISPINRLKKETVFIQNNIKALISKRNNEKSDILNCKRKLSETVNKCSSFQIDSKYTNCVNEADGILAGLSNNNYVLHDLSGINYQNEQHDDDSKYDE